MEIISNVILFIMLLSLFNLIRYMIKIRKVMQMHKDNPNIKGISIINGKIEVIEHQSESEKMQEVKELIVDPVCGDEVEKKEAYRILKENKEYYFCSWECREKFLQQTN